MNIFFKTILFILLYLYVSCRVLKNITVLLPYVDIELQSNFISFICSELDDSYYFFILSSEYSDLKCLNGKYYYIEGFERIDSSDLTHQVDADNVRIYLLSKQDNLKLAFALEILSKSSVILVNHANHADISCKIISALDEIIHFSKYFVAIPYLPSEWKFFIDSLENENAVKEQDIFQIPTKCTSSESCDSYDFSIMNEDLKLSIYLNSKQAHRQWLDGQLPDDLSLFDEFRKPEDDLVLDTIRVHTHTYVSDSSAGASGKIQ